MLQNIPSNGLKIEKILSRTFRKYSIGGNKFIYISKTPERQKKYKIKSITFFQQIGVNIRN